MAAYVNRKQVNDAGVGVKPWVPLNRWSEPGNYTIITTVTGAATYTIQSTVDPVNWVRRNDDIVVCDIENAVDLTTDGCLNVTETPLEAIRVNQSAGAGSVTMRVMQNGGS